MSPLETVMINVLVFLSQCRITPWWVGVERPRMRNSLQNSQLHAAFSEWVGGRTVSMCVCFKECDVSLVLGWVGYSLHGMVWVAVGWVMVFWPLGDIVREVDSTGNSLWLRIWSLIWYIFLFCQPILWSIIFPICRTPPSNHFLH